MTLTLSYELYDPPVSRDISEDKYTRETYKSGRESAKGRRNPREHPDLDENGTFLSGIVGLIRHFDSPRGVERKQGVEEDPERQSRREFAAIRIINKPLLELPSRRADRYPISDERPSWEYTEREREISSISRVCSPPSITGT